MATKPSCARIFAARGLDHLFDGGIFGGPDNKDVILPREMEGGAIRTPALFLGDSRYDFEAAQRAGLDFVFVSGWTEVKEWKSFVESNKLETLNCLNDLPAIFKDLNSSF